VADTVLVSHLEPEAQLTPPQVWSHTQMFRVGLHWKPGGQLPHVGGWQRPQVADEVSLLHTSLLEQPPPQVVSQEQVPQVAGLAGLLLHFWPAGQPPPQVVSHRHVPQVAETQAPRVASQPQPVTPPQLACD
jgi:hypothetical protein